MSKNGFADLVDDATFLRTTTMAEGHPRHDVSSADIKLKTNKGMHGSKWGREGKGGVN